MIKRTPDGVLDPTFGTDGVLQLPTFPTAVSIRGGIPMPGGTGMLLYGEGSQGGALLLVTTQPAATALPVIEVQGPKVHATGSESVEWYLNDLCITGEYDADYTPWILGIQGAHTASAPLVVRMHLLLSTGSVIRSMRSPLGIFIRQVII
ncbi:MAG: hypothetical protein R2811_12005 [Flavobacteriales bacterium]